MLLFLEGGSALGGVEALALALEALAEPGKEAGKAREDAWVVEGGLPESGEVGWPANKPEFEGAIERSRVDRETNAGDVTGHGGFEVARIFRGRQPFDG